MVVCKELVDRKSMELLGGTVTTVIVSDTSARYARRRRVEERWDGRFGIFSLPC